MSEQKTWKVGDIIRHRSTGTPFVVIQPYRPVGIMIAPMQERYPAIRMLFKRDYEDFARDCDMQITETPEHNVTWKFDPVPQII